MSNKVELTEAAKEKCQDLISKEDRSDLRLRIMVEPGGCSGLIYNLFFDDTITEFDTIESYDGFEVIIDKMSVPYLEGSTIDYKDTIESQGFLLDNPNAVDTCACGSSFN